MVDTRTHLSDIHSRENTTFHLQSNLTTLRESVGEVKKGDPVAVPICFELKGAAGEKLPGSSSFLKTVYTKAQRPTALYLDPEVREYGVASAAVLKI